MATNKLSAYQAKRDFSRTAEPSGEAAATAGPRLRFVIQKHAATRLHYDLRLELDGVFKSWAVTRGPSLDPHDKRLAVEVEDHPLDYGDFEGTIPKGQYGGGTVQLWDRGYWIPEAMTAEQGLASGDLKFTLDGERLHGSWVLVRMKPRPREKHLNWLLIKHRDEYAREADADTVLAEDRSVASGRPMADIEAGKGRAPKPFMTRPERKIAKDAVWNSNQGEPASTAKSKSKPKSRTKPPGQDAPPAEGAIPGAMPQTQPLQLCGTATEPPEGASWVSEIKFDGYRILAALEHGEVRLLTRNGHDWAARMPALQRAIQNLPPQSALIDGELVALRPDGVSSFPGLQSALKSGRDDTLVFYAFDLLHLNGWDLRPCTLLERKRLLSSLTDWTGMLRYSDHHAGQTEAMRQNACRMHLEGIICKRADAPYQPGRGRSWLKLKCLGREEFVVLGYTPPAGSRVGIGALHIGYYDPEGQLHYAGGVGSGFNDTELAALRKRLGAMAAPPPPMLVSGDAIDRAVAWVRPELVVELQFTDWSGAGRVRHAVYLGLREDKPAADVVRDIADQDAERQAFKPNATRAKSKAWHGAVPPLPKSAAPPPALQPQAGKSKVVVAQKPRKAALTIAGIEITHADRQLWPGVTKQDLAQYWQSVAGTALPGIAHRPLSILRCPEGIGGREKFFQKNGHGIMPGAIREGSALKQPYLAIDDAAGLVAMAQMSAIELHAWGATEADPGHPDQLVFDLDPGEGVAWADIVKAAQDTRARLEKLGLAAFCRTTGGKGLHVVVPLTPQADWTLAKPFARAFAEAMATEEPTRFLAHLKIADRKGRILIDWLRNGPGATAVASFSPRARPGATVATPLAWAEVTAKLDPAKFTLATIPPRLATLKADPWDGFSSTHQVLPVLDRKQAEPNPQAVPPQAVSPPSGKSRIVTASRPKARK